MIPLVDLHCHLLAGMDDGPRTDEEAVAMCRIAYEEGVRLAAATAHQNDRWSAVTPDGIRHGCQRLAQMLRAEGIALTVFPCAEVMVFPGIEASFRDGKLLSVADHGQYLLIEMPHGFFVDIFDIVQGLRNAGVRPILAHPERHDELLHDSEQIERLVGAGCLVQVSSASITKPSSREDELALKGWFQKGIVHLLGSDGHSPTRRPPKMVDAYRQVREWVGDQAADRVCHTNGLAIANGIPLRVPQPKATSRWWVPKLW